MPSPGMPIGNSQIPRPIYAVPLQPSSPRHTSKNTATGHLARMRYKPANAAAGSKDKLCMSPFTSTSQPLVQSWYSSKGQSPVESLRLARTLVELENLLQRINSYNREDSDLGRFGSALRVPKHKIESRLLTKELLKLPCDLRSASRAAANTIAKLKSGEQTDPIECNFNETKELLDRLDDLQPSLPKLVNESETKNDIGSDPVASNAALRLSMLSQSSTNALNSCDLPFSLANSSAGSSPSCEPIFSPPLHSAIYPSIARAGSASGLHSSSGIPRILGHHQKRMIRITRFNFDLQRPHPTHQSISDKR